MIVDADKAREKLAKLCEAAPVERPPYSLGQGYTALADAIRQADLSDCVIESTGEYERGYREALTRKGKSTLLVESQAAEIARLRAVNFSMVSQINMLRHLPSEP